MSGEFGEISAAEAGTPAQPPPAAERKDEDKVVFAENDKSRWLLGLAACFIGVALFVSTLVWAACSLTDALKAAEAIACIDPAKPVGVPHSQRTWLYVAKAVLVLTSGGFSLGLLRAGERLLMPLARYLQMVEFQSRKGAETKADDLLELTRKILEVGSKLPRG